MSDSLSHSVAPFMTVVWPPLPLGFRKRWPDRKDIEKEIITSDFAYSLRLTTFYPGHLFRKPRAMVARFHCHKWCNWMWQTVTNIFKILDIYIFEKNCKWKLSRFDHDYEVLVLGSIDSDFADSFFTPGLAISCRFMGGRTEGFPKEAVGGSAGGGTFHWNGSTTIKRIIPTNNNVTINPNSVNPVVLMSRLIVALICLLLLVSLLWPLCCLAFHSNLPNWRR